MRGEVLRPGKGSDPDELAVLIAALVRESGREPHITFEIDGGKIVAFTVVHVWPGGSAVVARLPCHPFVAVPGYVDTLNAAVPLFRPAAQADVASAAVELIDRLLNGLDQDVVALSPHERRLSEAVGRLRGPT